MDVLLKWITVHQVQLVPLLFGFVAVYLLMPREQQFFRSFAVGLGLVAIAGVLGFAIQPPDMTLHGLLFYVFAGTAILAAASMVTHRNPVYSALSFALVTLSVCGLFLLRGAQFLAAATVIVYAGAIVVTFLFIIMMARQSGAAAYDRKAREPFLATLAAFVLLGGVLFTIEDWVVTRATEPPHRRTFDGSVLASVGPPQANRNAAGFIPLSEGASPHPNSKVAPGETSRLRGLGRTLFTDYLVAVELAGTLLLVAGVGAVAIAPRRNSGTI